MGEMLLHAFVPVAPQFLCMLDHLLIFLFNLLAVAGEIGKHISHLAGGQIEPVLDEFRWPASMQVIQDGVEGNPCPCNRQAATCADYSWLSIFCWLHRPILQRKLAKRCIFVHTRYCNTIPAPKRYTYSRLPACGASRIDQCCSVTENSSRNSGASTPHHTVHYAPY